MMKDPAQRLPGSRVELYSWLFMRISGILLVFLALGHLAIMHLIHNVDEIDYAFVVERLVGPWGVAWRVYDLLLLVLALVHGLNGMRAVLDEHIRAPRRRAQARLALYVVGAVFLALGAFVLFAFQPQGLA